MFVNNQKGNIKKKEKPSGKYVLNKLFIYTLLSSGLLPIIYLFTLYSLTNSCAQQQQLTGGPRDTIPPKLIKELSTPNFQTNFEKQAIELVFDEYIEIRNVIKQVVISPPLTYIPKVERKKGFKTAQFQFDEKEVLKEGVTYAISFGESINDLTESNKVENLQFLFSTGDYIDSLKMTGQIADALTGDPVSDVLFMLYENFADTVVRTEKPYYFGKTDKEGKFTINYLKAGKYKGFALEDQDLNYLFNIPTERIGFTLDTIIIQNADSIITDVQVQLFEEITTLDKPKVNVKTYGMVKMGFRRNPYDAILTYDSIGQELYREVDGDTVRYWYNPRDTLDWNFYLQRDTLVDTFLVRNLTRVVTPLKLSRERKAEERIPLNPFKYLPITFNLPLKNLDTSLINFTEVITNEANIDSTDITTLIDSLGTEIDSLAEIIPLDSLKQAATDSSNILITDTIPTNIDTSLLSLEQRNLRLTGDFRIDSINKRMLVLAYDWEEKVTYQLEILPGALIDWYDEPNPDTIVLVYEVQPKNDFGTINLIVTEMDSLQNYWFQLLLGENVVAEFLVNNTKEYKRSFTALLPGKYSLKVIEDLNGNSRWDPGNYDKKLQPEKISTATIEELRAGWDVAAEVKIDFNQ